MCFLSLGHKRQPPFLESLALGQPAAKSQTLKQFGFTWREAKTSCYWPCEGAISEAVSESPVKSSGDCSSDSHHERP